MDVITFKSQPKISPFAPEYEWRMFETFVTGVNFKELAQLILTKEQEILKQFPVPISAGLTGLGPNSLTSRFEYFNVLKWDHPEITKLLDDIKKHHLTILEITKIPRRKLWIQCWANVLRTPEKMNAHIHDTSSLSYLGGHVTVQCDQTFTVYVNPIEQLSMPQTYDSINQVGKITFFQNNIPHFTTEHLGPKERISIAFDIILDEHPKPKNNLLLFDSGE
jgi:hypothetical protein